MPKILDKLWTNVSKAINGANQNNQTNRTKTFTLSDKVILFKENFEVIDINDLSKFEKSRKQLKQEKNLSLYSNLVTLETKNSNEDSEKSEKDSVYYEIVYSRGGSYSFIVYHTTSIIIGEQYFEYFCRSLNRLSKSISMTKSTAFEQLQLIMESLKINCQWSSTHIAARLGLETHFKESRDIVSIEVNLQMDDDRMTPLHLAINHRWPLIVQNILDLLPDLNLRDSKQYSFLHSAALSTHEIFTKILYQPNMFNRILWKNYQGSTALHLACFSQNYNVVFEFLKFGLTTRMLTLPPPKQKVKSMEYSQQTTSSKKRVGSRKKKMKSPQTPHIVQFTEQDLLDIDIQDIVMAGSPLHWAKHRRLLEKLIAYKIRLNTPNMNEDTPLHLMVKRNRLRCVLTLLCSGARVNVQNKFGNTPLHHAVKIDEITLTQTLVVFDADIDILNKAKESARHLAAKESPFSAQILFVLSSLGAKRCSGDQKNCNAGCREGGDFDGKWSPALIELTKQYESIFRNIKNQKHFNEEMKKDTNEKISNENVNLLALDGGGIKGLITVQLMIELQKYLKRPIIDYFHWITGTSTGSFLVIFLVTGTPLSHIRNIYMQFKDKVFIGERPYDAEPLEKLLKGIIGSEVRMEDLLTNYHRMVIIPAGLIDRKPMKLHLFRSYESHNEILKLPDFDKGFIRLPSREQLVWQACRASGSAPTYFKTFGPYIDGGLISCNPTLDAMTEIEFRNIALREVGRESECHKLRFVLSFGTGQQQIEESKAIDIGAFSLRLTELNNQIRYMYQMASLLLNEICNTDNHIVNR